MSRINEHFNEIEDKTKTVYAIAEEARKKGLDPMSKVEVPLAASLAEKAVGLIATIYPQVNNKQIVNRILELEREHGRLDPAVYFKISEEVAKEKFCKFSSLLEAMDAGIRIGFAYNTLGVVSSPIEGFTGIKVGKTRKNEDYIIAYFSGPIRSAGTTASCIVLMIIDYLRELFGFAKYDPEEKEIKRYVTENYDYHERCNNLQYLPTEEEIMFLAKNLPIQIAGEPTEQKEVSNYKDLDRVETNFIRGGMCLCFSEGLAQKAQKGLRLWNVARSKGCEMTGWLFLDDYIKLHKKREKGSADASPTYIKDTVAGRPVFGHPSKSGGFRFRYGRSRTSGFSAASIHPATMGISDSFLSIGNQLKIEKPTKGCAISSCDGMDGPIVKLKNGSVRYIKDFETAKQIYSDVEEIIYLGDILIPFGDVLNRNYELIKSGYVEEWWGLELRKTEKELGIQADIEDVFGVDFDTAKKISEKFGVSLHPKHIFYWSQISYEDFMAFIDWIAHSKINGKIMLPYNRTEKERFLKGKRAMELLGIEHEVSIENVILNSETSKALLANIGTSLENFESEINNILGKIKEIKIEEINSALDIVTRISKYRIKDKAGTFIGSRMGRPEKAKLRKLIGSPNVLFPVGEEGGRMRSVNEAFETGSVKADFPIYHCKNCNRETIYFKCEKCESECERINYCPECKQKFTTEKCPEHVKGQCYMPKKIDMKEYFNHAIKELDLLPDEIPKLIKGVKGTSNKNHISENLAKGFLRALLNLQVNKDGTIRFDATEMPITHFKPFEIRIGVSKLRELGYVKDINGRELENEEQILELKPHDILLPSCPDSKDEKADDVFVRIAHFLDLLLVKFYKMKPFYNIRSREDLAGHLVVCMAPHNCAGVVGRIIGFSKTQTLLASPYMHAAMRRDCVHPSTKIFFYDEDCKEVYYDNIGEYIENLIKLGAKTKKIDSFGTLSVENIKKLYALGADPATHELTKKKIKYFIKGPETEEWVKITTATNREYTMTPTHKFMHIEDGNFKFKDAKEVQVDDKLPVLENFNFNAEIKEINLIKLFKEKLSNEEQKEILVIGQGKEKELNNFNPENSRDLKLRHKFSHHILPAILNIDNNLMRILGYYASEGYSRRSKQVSQVAFRICDEDMQINLIRLIKDCFGITPNLGEGNTKITICSKLVYYLFQCLNAGKGAYDKRVPKFIFGLDKELVRDYISSYFEGDGSIIKSKGVIAFYSVSRDLLDDIALLLAKFRIFGRYFRTELRLPGKTVLEKYKKLGKEPKQHVLNHLVLGVYDSFNLGKILNLVNTKKAEGILHLRDIEKRYLNYNNKQIPLVAQSDYLIDYVKKVEIIKDKKNSYCVEIDWQELEDRNVLWGEQIINTRCDGDEAAVMMLLDVLLNFSREYLPAHRGGTQDAPLVLNYKLRAGEVDDQILDFELVSEYPLELYEKAEQGGHHSSEIKVETVRTRLALDQDPFIDTGFTHPTSDINDGVLNSTYKLIPTMKEKVEKEMALVEKIRAVNTTDVARLIIDRHFIRDIRGNLRKFSQQEFRCSKCNQKYRRPPLIGKCMNCGGNVIFTISEGSIIKYLEPAIALAQKYNIPAYMKQSLELTKSYIESIFGHEKEKQEALKKWF